jgi:hypothetical protein
MSKSKLITEQIKKIRPLIKEASPQQKLKLMKLMKVALKEGFDERTVLIRKLASTGKYDVSDLELATDEELQQLLTDEGEINEAKIHFTDPSTKVNLYYVPPKLENEGKVQNIAHNIPYSTVQPLINRLMQKYPNLNPDYMVWYTLGKDKYGQRLEESLDYLEEK